MSQTTVLEAIEALIIVLVPPPTVVGAGHANLAMKFMKFCHSLRLLTPDAATLEEVLRSILVCLTDFGTEIGLARISPIPIHQVLLWDASAQPPSMENEDDVDFTRPEDEEVDFAAPSGPPVADLSGSIEVAGILHIIHNAMKSLASAMPRYESETRSLKHVCRLLSRKESRTKLLSSCFQSRGHLGVELAKSPELCTFQAHVHTERWGTVAHAIERVLAVRDVLLWGWDLRRYSPQSRPDQEREENDHPVKVDVVDKAMRSAASWGTW